MKRPHKRISAWRVWQLLMLVLVACFAAMVVLSGSAPTSPLGRGGSQSLSSPGVRPSSPPAAAAAQRADSSPRLPAKALPQVAIIVDDIGGDMKIVRELEALGDVPLTASILPFLAYTRQAAEELSRAGFEIILHQPMEPIFYPAKDPGEGAVFVSMGPEEIRKTVQGCLDQVPMAVGMNNHMGSKATSCRRTMDLVMRVVRERSLFFVDSVTHGRSLAFDAARNWGVPTARRDLFLDNKASVSSIEKQLDRLVLRALRNGKAVGICHGRPHTLAALKRWLVRGSQDRRFRLSFASEVVR